MPVIIKPSPEKDGRNSDRSVRSSSALLKATSETWAAKQPQGVLAWPEDGRKVLQSAFDDHEIFGLPVVPYPNGLVDGIIRAFNQDLHLILRPDDIWLAIITQFSTYVNSHTEELRHHFVAGKDKKEVVVRIPPSPAAFSHEFDIVANLYLTLAPEYHAIDPDLQDRLLPEFSTTTPEDAGIASFVMLGSLQTYFKNRVLCGCGFPSVILRGQRPDWEHLVTKAQRLLHYGPEAEEWGRLLIPVLRRMLESYDSPDSAATKDFWLRACYDGAVKDVNTLSGWVTAFCFWNENGDRIRGYSQEDIRQANRRPLNLDGIEYPMLRPGSVPSAIVTLPVTADDISTNIKYQTTIIAGIVGATVSGQDSTFQPKSAWWMLLDGSNAWKKEEEELNSLFTAT